MRLFYITMVWVTLAGCARSDLAREDSLRAAAEVDRDALRPGIRFDPSTLKPGARVGDLVVDTIDAQYTSIDSSWVGMARFRGQLTLSGSTVRHPDSDVRHLCFEADAASAARMPRWAGDERRPWLCFENTADAVRVLGSPRTVYPATVVIDNFTIYRGLGDEVNEARFVSVAR